MGKKFLYFNNLDTIRFIAAMMVFLSHTISTFFSHHEIETDLIRKIIGIIANGGLGVTIFFVLSGFLITYLIIKEIDENSKLNIKFFYLRRFLRIWPLYYAVIFFSFLFYPGLKTLLGLNTPLDSDIVYHLTFLTNFDVLNMKEASQNLTAMSQNITWSVSVEEQFYLIWPLIFLLPRRFWIHIMSAILLFSLYFRSIHLENNDILYFHTFSVLVDLVIGGLLAYLIKSYESVEKVFKHSGTVTHFILFTLFFLILYFDILSFLFGEYNKIIGRLILALVIGLIVATQAFTQNRSVLCLGNFKFGDKWGKMTYGIYLLHPIAITLTDVLLRILKIDYKSSIEIHSFVIIFIFCFTLFISWVSYTYYEGVFIKLKNRFQLIKTN